jgi:hypothetical protein
MSSWIAKEFNRVVRLDVSDYTIIPTISEETKRIIGEMRKDPAHAAYMRHLESLGIASRESYLSKNRWKEPPSINPEFISIKEIANRRIETHREKPEALFKYLEENAKKER